MKRKIYVGKNDTDKELYNIVSQLSNTGCIEYDLVETENEADLLVTSVSLQDYIWQICEKKHLLIKNDVLFVDCFLFLDNQYWAAISTSKGYMLGCIDKTGTILEFNCIPLMTTVNRRFFSSLLYEGEKLYLIPDRGKSIWVFDRVTSVWNEILIPNAEHIQSLFRTARINNGRIHLFPMLYPGVVVFNINECRIEKIIKCNEKASSLSFCSSMNLYEMDDRCFFYSRSENAILSYDFRETLITVEKSGFEELFILTEIYENSFILINKECLCLYDIFKKVCKKYYINLVDSVYLDDDSFSESFLHRDYIFLLPGKSDIAAKLNIKSCELMTYTGIKNDLWDDKSWKCFGTYKAKGENLIFDDVSKELIVWNNGNVKRKKISFDTERLVIYLLSNDFQN